MREQCNRGEERLVVYCPVKPLMSRLPVCQNLLMGEGDRKFEKKE
jgi:hypothetical protein